MPAQLLQERQDPLGIDIRLGIKAKEQPDPVPGGRNGQGGDDGDFSIGIGPMSEQGSLATRSPRPSHQRHHQEAAFVNKDEGRAYPGSVFFTRGQLTLTQVWMAASSRSMARRCGFWGLQPKECKIRPI